MHSLTNQIKIRPIVHHMELLVTVVLPDMLHQIILELVMRHLLTNVTVEVEDTVEQRSSHPETAPENLGRIRGSVGPEGTGGRRHPGGTGSRRQHHPPPKTVGN